MTIVTSPRGLSSSIGALFELDVDDSILKRVFTTLAPAFALFLAAAPSQWSTPK